MVPAKMIKVELLHMFKVILNMFFKVHILLHCIAFCRDVSAVISAIYPETSPPIILMGHSMGGAIAVHATHNEYIDSVVALIVIDVVEGTAVDALASMQSFLRSRPASFKSVKDAISWRLVGLQILNTKCFKFNFYLFIYFYSLFNGQVKNVESAQVSVPGQIKK